MSKITLQWDKPIQTTLGPERYAYLGAAATVGYIRDLGGFHYAHSKLTGIGVGGVTEVDGIAFVQTETERWIEAAGLQAKGGA